MTVTRPDIPTALTDKEADELVRRAFGRSVLEIGALLGYSTVVLASAADRVISVDPHIGYPADDPRPTLNRFLRNLDRYGVRDTVTVMLGRDDEVLPLLAENQFDLAFVDCTGEYDTTLNAMKRATQLLKKGGALAVHDCGHPDWPGANKAVLEFARVHELFFHLTDRLAVFPDIPW